MCTDAQAVHCSKVHSLRGGWSLEPSSYSTGQAVAPGTGGSQPEECLCNSHTGPGQAGAALPGEQNRDELPASHPGTEP